ncbi:hypothetical protein HZS_3155 [Henneguya salminicola]|nr:hypothetical protein HZS_3155 [Henneguya salminicola]
MVDVPDHTAVSLININLTHDRPGSTIITDYFKSYHNIRDNFQHLTVKYLVEFVDSTYGACTNTIVKTGNGLKIKNFPKNRTK